MHAAFISTMTTEPWGGSEELWSRAALRLRTEGHDVSASVPWWPELSSKVAALRDAGVRVSTAKSRFQLTIAARGWGKLARRMGTPSRELSWLRQQSADLVVITQGAIASGLEWMDACIHGEVPFAVIVQCNHESFWPNDHLGPELAEGYRKARRVYCVSRHNLNLLERQLAEKLPNAEVVWNPTNVATDLPPAWPGDQNEILKIASVGRLDPPAKGQDLLLEVLAMPKWRERSVQVSFYGGGLYAQAVKKLAQWLNLNNVSFNGHVRDVRGIWAANHLLIMPSRFEGLPLALVESMWCSRPAIVTDVGGNAEVCIDGETGFIADAPTVSSLDKAMERAWHARAALKKMGETARARIEAIAPRDPVAEFCTALKGCVESRRESVGGSSK